MRSKPWSFLAAGAGAAALFFIVLALRAGRQRSDVRPAAETAAAAAHEQVGDALAASALVTAPPALPGPQPTPESAPPVKGRVAAPAAAATRVRKAPAAPATAPKNSLYSRE